MNNDTFARLAEDIRAPYIWVGHSKPAQVDSWAERIETLAAAYAKEVQNKILVLEDAIYHAKSTIICSCVPAWNRDVDDVGEIKKCLEVLDEALNSCRNGIPWE